MDAQPFASPPLDNEQELALDGPNRKYALTTAYHLAYWTSIGRVRWGFKRESEPTRTHLSLNGAGQAISSLSKPHVRSLMTER